MKRKTKTCEKERGVRGRTARKREADEEKLRERERWKRKNCENYRGGRRRNVRKREAEEEEL